MGDIQDGRRGALVYAHRASSCSRQVLNVSTEKLSILTSKPGLLRLYRLKTSDHVCFLHSGDLLLSLLPRSQVWCIDGVSKFATRIHPHIYRIELPVETDDDLLLLEDFKSVLSKVLYYERTPCPFKRGFAKDDAEDLPSPKVRRSRGESKKARKWELKRYWRPEGDDEYVPDRPSSTSSADSVDNPSISDGTNGTTGPQDGQNSQQRALEPDQQEPINRVQGIRTRFNVPGPAHLTTGRMVSADGAKASRPQGSSIVDASSSTPAQAIFRTPQLRKVSDLASQFSAAATESPTSLTSSGSDSPITPTAPSDRLLVAKRAMVEPEEHRTIAIIQQGDKPEYDQMRDLLAAQEELPLRKQDHNSTEHEPEESLRQDHDGFVPLSVIGRDSVPATVSIANTTSSRPHTPPNPTPPQPVQATAHQPSPASGPSTPKAKLNVAPLTPPTTRRRTASPRSAQRFRSDELPDYIKNDSPNLDKSSAQLALTLSPTALVQKTCALLLGPPSGLVQIMVQIAARLHQAGASGAFRVLSYKSRGRALPGRWEDSDEEDDEYSPWREVTAEDDEDDFGVSLGVETPARDRRRGFGLASPDNAVADEHDE